MSSVSIMAIFGSCIRSESAKSDKRQLIVSTVAANGRDAPLSAVRTRRARALDSGGRCQSSARVLLAARLIVSKPRPPRVLADYDEEFGYIVLGTHDVDVARTMLYAHLDRPERQRYLGRTGLPSRSSTLAVRRIWSGFARLSATRATAGRSSTPSHTPAAPPELSSGVIGSIPNVSSRQGALEGGLRVRRWVLPA